MNNTTNQSYISSVFGICSHADPTKHSYNLNALVKKKPFTIIFIIIIACV